jgi:mRNA interferase RelE/StbE
MIVKTDRSFDKDINKITDSVLCNKVADVIEKMQLIENINNLVGIKKLVGYINYYRIRIGDYRIGFRIENGIIILERCMHRKDIYRFFPKD